MTDLTAMIWKETAEFFGNRRSLRIFVIAILAMGILPVLSFSHHQVSHSSLVLIIRVIYVLFATAVVVAQTAPDLVLHERVGHTLDYLLTTRIPDYAIFGSKVLFASMVGYVAAMLALGIQLVGSGLFGGSGWHWLFLSFPLGRIAAFGATAALSVYVAVVGTFVALRVGDQRAAYMVSIFAVAILMVPFLVGWLHVSLTTQWAVRVTLVFAAIAIVCGLVGLRLFRRDMLVLYLRD